MESNNQNSNLVTAVSLFVCTALIACGLFFSQSVDNAREQAYLAAEESAAEQLSTLDAYIKGVRAVLEAYADAASRLEPREYGSAGLLDGMNSALRGSGITEGFLAGADGVVTTGTGRGIYIGDREYYKKAAAGGRGLEFVREDLIHGVSTMLFSAPVMRDGAVEAVVVAAVATENIRALLTSDIYGGAAYSFLCDREGGVLVGPEDGSVDVLAGSVTELIPSLNAREALAESLAAGESGRFIYVVGNAKRYAVYAAAEEGVTLINAVPHAAMVRASRANAITSGAVIVAVMALTGLIMAFILGRDRRAQLALEHERNELRERDEENAIVIEHSGKSVLRYYIKAREIETNGQFLARFGFERRMEDFPEAFIEGGAVAEESIAEFRRIYEDMTRGERGGGHDVLLATRDEGERWFHADYTVIADAYGRPYCAIISVYDNTEKKQNEIIYQKSVSDLKALLEGCVSYMECSLTRNVIDRIEGFRCEYEDGPAESLSFSELIEDNASRLIHPEEREEYLTFYERGRLIALFASGVTECRSEYRSSARGDMEWFSADVKMVGYPSTGEVKAFIIIRDINEERAQRESLEKLAYKDALTDLLNRAATELRTRKCLEEADSEDQSAMIMVDLDFFKTVNDTLGHQAGDETLRLIAEVISRSFRKDDILGRFGGDEFLAFIPRGATISSVRKKAQGIVESLQFDVGGVSLSASIGVSLCTGGSKSFEALYAEADAALYQAKEAGKGRYHIFGMVGDAEEASAAAIPGEVPASVRLQTLLENMDGGVVLAEVDEDIRVTYVSPSFYKSLGFTEGSEAAEEAIISILPEYREAVFAAARRAAAGEVTDCCYQVRGGFWRQLRAARLSSEPGGTVTVIGVVTDITEIKASEERYQLAQERYRVATELSRAMMWEVDLQARTLIQSDDLARLLGRGEVCYLNMPEGLIAADVIHRDSVRTLRELFEDMYAGTDGREYPLLINAGNGDVWVKASFRLLRDNEGRAVRAVGVLERMPNADAEMAAFREELRFVELTAPSLLGAVVADLTENTVERRFLGGEERLEHASYEQWRAGLAAAASIEHRGALSDLMCRERLLECQREGQTWLFLEYEREGGVWVTMAVNLLRQPINGNILAFFYFRDVTVRSQWTRAVPSPARDSATSLYTSETVRSLASAVMDSAEEGTGFAVTQFELSGFDALKANQGYQAAQKLLFTFGRLCRIILDGPIIVGHVAEQRFVVFRADSGGEHRQRRVIEKSLERMAALLRQIIPGYRLAISCGFAVGVRGSVDYDELLRRAEVACAASIACPGAPLTAYSEPGPYGAVESGDHDEREEERPSVLITDDDGMTRKLLTNLLARHYDTDTACDGAEALEKLRAGKFDLLITDIVMPRMTGFELLDVLRADRALADTPVVVITADTTAESEIRALSMGASDVVTKPFVARTLLSRVSNLIGKRKAARVAEQMRLYELQFQQQANLLSIAQRDELTGIYNRRAFYSVVREALEREEEKRVIVLFDVDNFKVFNDALGVEAGDRLLRDIATALRETSPEGVYYARLEADHFVLCLPEREFDEERFVGYIQRWFESYPVDFRITGRMGVYLIDDPSVDVGIMCDRALLALRSVKGSYTLRAAWYDEGLRQKLVEEQELTGEMVSALADGQFQVYFQPQYDYDSGCMIGAEALVRWEHPEKGVIGPGTFIPLFERSGFISVMDEYVWEQSCRYMSAWRERKGALLPVSVSVNISRIDIYDPRLIEKLSALVDKYSLPTASLRLEITESAYIQNPELLTQTVKKLREAGFSVEIDDFGAGYSSLTTLKDVPVDLLKLDMRFLSPGEDDSRGGNLLSSVIRMAHWLKLPIIAEGVETREQADYLKSLGCFYMQGYYFAAPMPAAQFENLLERADIAPLDCYENVSVEGMAAFWDPSAQNALLFNSLMGGAGIMEYNGSTVELVRANDAYFRELGTTRAAYQSYVTDVMAPIEPEDRAAFLALTEDLVRTGEELRREMSMRLGGGERARRVRCRVKLLSENNGRFLFFVSVEDISDLCIAEHSEK